MSMQSSLADVMLQQGAPGFVIEVPNVGFYNGSAVGPAPELFVEGDVQFFATNLKEQYQRLGCAHLADTVRVVRA